MQLALPRYYTRRLWRAIVEFELLSDGDRVLVGFSGGKDSSFLIYALRALQAKSPFDFTVGAVHVDLGFAEPSAAGMLEDFCRQLEVPFYLEQTQIAHTALKEGRHNPCSTCAYFRRAVVNKVAVSHGYNKVALAHHHDDAVETFLMSQLYSGQLQTFLPKSFLDKSGLTVIRPLVYLREAKIRQFIEELPYEPMPSRCPLQGKTHRWKVKELIRELTSENESVYTNIAAAMREGANMELWPTLAGREEMREKHLRIMRPTISPGGRLFDFPRQEC